MQMKRAVDLEEAELESAKLTRECDQVCDWARELIQEYALPSTCTSS